jgi:prefoldin subunit 5
MEFIPESLFDSSLGQEFLVRTIYMPMFSGTTNNYGYNQQEAYNYTKTMVCGGTTNITVGGSETVYENGELTDKSKSITSEVTSDGKILENYKKDISKLNDKLTNLKDCLTSIITSTASYVAAVAIPFSMAAGIAGIMSTIGQLKSLKSIIKEVKDLLEKLNLTGDTLDSLVPGAGTLINGVLDLIESLVGTLTSIIPV